MFLSDSESVAGPDRKALSLQRRLVFSGVTSLLFLLILIAVEITTRLAMEPVASLELFVVNPQQREGFADGDKSSIFEGDPLLMWRLKPGLKDAYWDFTAVTTNSGNFREESPDRVFSRKTAETVRIVCLGDTVTFGYRTPLVYPGNPTSFDRDWVPYPMLLERHLRAANPVASQAYA